MEPVTGIAFKLCQRHVGTFHIQLLRAECGMETRKQQVRSANSPRSPRASNAGIPAVSLWSESCQRASASSTPAGNPGWRRRESYSTAPSGSPPTLDKNDRSFIEEAYPITPTENSLRKMETNANDLGAVSWLFMCRNVMTEVGTSIKYPCMLLPVKDFGLHEHVILAAERKMLRTHTIE